MIKFGEFGGYIIADAMQTQEIFIGDDFVKQIHTWFVIGVVVGANTCNLNS